MAIIQPETITEEKEKAKKVVLPPLVVVVICFVNDSDDGCGSGDDSSAVAILSLDKAIRLGGVVCFGRRLYSIKRN